MCRRLIFTTFTHTNNNKYHYCYNIWQHLEYFLCAHTEILNVIVNNEQSTKKN